MKLGFYFSEQGDGVGAVLLRHAMTLSLSLAPKISLHALVVDTKSESVTANYARFGFARFVDQTLSLFLNTDVIRRAQQSTDQPAARH